jgi:uncharacterized membrane protein
LATSISKAPVIVSSPAVTAPAERLTAVDALRGIVMVIMALDHVRDFFHADAMLFTPDDLSRTTPVLFFTRWITHICAPAFFFLAGLSAGFRLRREGSTTPVSRFLLARGLWLVAIELVVMRLALNFTFDPRYPILLLVLWALGVSMIALAALIHLPTRALAVLSLAVIALHNLLDGVQAAQFGAFDSVWQILHQPGAFVMAGAVVVVGYPVLPWIAVMAAGFCFAPVFSLDTARRRRALAWTGTCLVVLFFLVRLANVYGDPVPWSQQSSALFTLLSFLNVTKYPPSLDFILMTLGPALLALAWFDRRGLSRDHPFVVIGRVPFFYFIVHFWVIHALASLMAWLRYGNASLAYLFAPLPSMGGPRDLFPPDFGYSLWVVYAVWTAVVVALYPLCRWFDGLKQRRRAWWMSYL